MLPGGIPARFATAQAGRVIAYGVILVEGVLLNSNPGSGGQVFLYDYDNDPRQIGDNKAFIRLNFGTSETPRFIPCGLNQGGMRFTAGLGLISTQAIDVTVVYNVLDVRRPQQP